jgi:hypothetical protein
MDWSLVADKFADIFESAAYQIRRVLPSEADDIVAVSLEALANETVLSGHKFPVRTEQGLVELPIEGLMEMVGAINSKQKASIRSMAERLGTIVSESPETSLRLVAERCDSIAVRVDSFVLSVDKNLALKVVSLGCIP